MKSGIRRTRLLMVGVFLLGLVAAIGAPGPAEAMCNGIGGDDNYWHNNYGREIGRWGTCDGDGYYRGGIAEFRNSQGDGHCAVVRARAAGGSWTWQGYSCRNHSQYALYTWNPGTTTGFMKICKGWRSWDCTNSQTSSGM